MTKNKTSNHRHHHNKNTWFMWEMLYDKRTWEPEDIVRKLSHFIDEYKQFPGEPLLICYLEIVITHQWGWIPWL